MNSEYPNETNGLGPEGSKGILESLDASPYDQVLWSDPDLKRITRLRLLSDPGFPMWDVSYCIGEMRDGFACRVILPFDQLPKRNVNAAITFHARCSGVYAKGLGIFDVISRLW